MKTINEILANYKEYVILSKDDIFTEIFSEYLTPEQLKSIGCEFKPEYALKHQPKAWTKNNIIKRLLMDAQFGKECTERKNLILSSILHELCINWCKILERTDLIKLYSPSDYGLATFDNILRYL